jgi:HAD superfamily hydrolase (TIGR01490 family)
MLTRRLMLKAAWGQLVYAQIGASPEKLEKLREAVLNLTKGWDQAEISRIVRDTLEDVIEPIVFAEALERIRDHQRQGHKVFIVSASPEEVVAPIARLLGVDEAIATRAELDDEGRYSGRTGRYVYGPEKEVAILEVAARDGLDLAASWAYSDSATDVPMLSAVGHPVAVNPDRELAKVAKEKGWDVEQFSLEVRLRAGGGGDGSTRLPRLRPRGASSTRRRRGWPGRRGAAASSCPEAKPRGGRVHPCRSRGAAASTSRGPRSAGCARASG